MGFYSKHILPGLTDLAMRNEAARAERAQWVPLAVGEVLEVGAGSGLNFAHYAPGVSRLFALEPSDALRRMAARRAERAPCAVEFMAASAETIPLASESVDTVVTTWTLCTIHDAGRALHEIRRVLRRDGRLIFIEHGRSPDPRVARWQERLTPAWRRITGGCHLNRPIDALIAAAGFELAELKRSYGAGPRVGSYLYRGVARVDAATIGAAERTLDA
jgi:ubiquinone/menaquinone biosynthesis C-methylase UbiE